MQILDAAIGAGWAMEQWAVDDLLRIAAREHRVTPEALEAYRAKALERAEQATERDGVAILAVEGPLFRRANLMTEHCGATAYETLRRDLQAAVDNPSVRAILLNVDSPGGEVSGANGLATAVREARAAKPIWAYAGDLAASAAYWIASAADRIVIGESAGLGSIGVRAAFTDSSERDAKSGLKRIEFVSSLSPYKAANPTSDDGRARIQARVDALAEVFVTSIARNRDASRAYVLERFGRGDVLIGRAAVDAGMADEIGTFEGTLKALASGKSGQLSRASRLTKAVREPLRAVAVHPAIMAERERALSIIRGTPPGREHVRERALTSGASFAEFEEMIAADAILDGVRLLRGG